MEKTNTLHTANRKKAFRSISIALLSSALIACGSDSKDDTGVADPIGLTANFKSIQDNVFTPNCTTCHSGASPAAGLNLTDGNAYANLVGIGSSGQSGAVRVITNDPDNSYLIKKLEGAADIAGLRMPRNGEPLTDATIQVIRNWIADGALDN